VKSALPTRLKRLEIVQVVEELPPANTLVPGTS
jgi:hypothetical protein